MHAVDPEVPRRTVSRPSNSANGSTNPPMQASTWHHAPTLAASSATAAIGSTTPCGYCGAEPTTSTVWSSTAAAIASTSAAQSSATGVVTIGIPNRCADLWNAAWAPTRQRRSSRSVMPRSARRPLACREHGTLGSTRCRRWSGSRPPSTARATARQSIRRPRSGSQASDGKACVLSAFSCRYSGGGRARRPRGPGAPPSYTRPNVRPSAQRVFAARLATRSAITSSIGRPSCGSSIRRSSHTPPPALTGRSAEVLRRNGDGTWAYLIDLPALSPRRSVPCAG